MHTAQRPLGLYQCQTAWPSPRVGQSLSLPRSRPARTSSISTSCWQLPGSQSASSSSSAYWRSSFCASSWPSIERPSALHRGIRTAVIPDGKSAAPGGEGPDLLGNLPACIASVLSSCWRRFWTAAADKQQQEEQQQQHILRQQNDAGSMLEQVPADSLPLGQQQIPTASAEGSVPQHQSPLGAVSSPQQQQQQSVSPVQVQQQRYENEEAVPLEVQNIILEEQYKEALTELPKKFRDFQASVVSNCGIALFYLLLVAVALRVFGVGQVGMVLGLSALEQQKASPASLLLLYGLVQTGSIIAGVLTPYVQYPTHTTVTPLSLWAPGAGHQCRQAGVCRASRRCCRALG